ncbi:MEDS domain-containing protein [Micromonospora sp. NPDC049559]|uniref:MEDS domain-containing protein n=1 Tax=Micromonospora sp. NPDC049559 TaxID=3155923 RepID=UPI00341CB9EE
MRGSAIWHGLALGDHVCVPTAEVSDQPAMLHEFADAGLREGQKVLLATSRPAPSALVDALRAKLPGAPDALAHGQLVVSDAADIYFPDGRFDPERTLRTLAAEIDLAEREGYPGLRISGDLTWAAAHGVDGRLLADYETRANLLFVGGRALGVCHYDPRQFASTAWQELVAAHPASLRPATQTPVSGLRCVLTVAPTGLAVDGEADLSNRAALSSVLSAVVPMPGRCVIDATGLRFADAYAMSSLVDVAVARGDRPTTLVCSPRLARLLDLLDVGRVPALSLRIGTAR